MPNETIQAGTDAESNSRKRKATENDSDLEPSVKKRHYPTQNQHEHSVVQIDSDFFIADYDNPWRDPKLASCSGSGFVVQDSTGKKYILTNAHVAENTTFLQIRLANNRIKKYEATVKCVSYQCDLALLEVEDPEFHHLVTAVELGDMVSLRDKIMVVGFPIGGTEISLSKGIVSRIQVDSYSMSHQRLLQAQVDAAINPGNSGGPVFFGNKVVGVAFQGYRGRQGLSYIIPTPIIKHFLNEAFSDKKYRGFPTIPMITEEIESSIERNFYNMGTKSGIRVLKVDTLSNAFNQLKPDDILLAIDGLIISNEGTVDIPGIGKCIDLCHMTQSKFTGDSVTLTILRKNKELKVDVLLDTILGDTEKVTVKEHDKMPTYYINSGICFVPLTRNYMKGSGAEFGDVRLVEENCYLTDAPKKNPDDQIVVINTIFNCEKTYGYEKHIRSVIKRINGKLINNIDDVVRAMEENQGERHTISLTSNSKIVIPNMSVKEHALLLRRNHISRDRSTDLERVLSLKKSALNVEEMELTQSGMHALFAHMGYANIISGSIYDDNPTLNLDALNHQGFMPILADVGQKKVAGHWIMLIQGPSNEYFIFDPEGGTSGINYSSQVVNQLPEDASLYLIPNEPGFNRGLCGYWVASIGLKIHATLNQDGPSNLALLGLNISEAMQQELTDNGFMKILSWLQSITEKFTGPAATKPIDASELRRGCETGEAPKETACLSQSNQKTTPQSPPANRRIFTFEDEDDNLENSDDSSEEETDEDSECSSPTVQRFNFFQQPSAKGLEENSRTLHCQ